jgi:nucleotide-binding universal stress UspA family protein
MRVLCCLDGTNVEQVSKATTMLSTSETLTLGLLYVIDTGPWKDIGRTRERFLRRPGPPALREQEMQQTEAGAAREILEEGMRHLPGAETLERQGRPEREIVNAAAEWRADLIMINARAEYDQRPVVGPKSVGHVARFVLDHAPCPVLLVRPLTRERFPIPT